MSWTKRQIIEQAFEELGLAAYDFDLQPEQVESARRKLNNMVAGWSSRNIQIGFPLPSGADSDDIDDDTDAPDYVVDAMIYNLAIRIAPSMGKQVSADTRAAAREAYDNMIRMSVIKPISIKLDPMLSAGAGHKRCSTFIQNKDDNVVLSPNQDLELFNE